MHVGRKFRFLTFLLCLTFLLPIAAQAFYASIRPGTQGQQVLALQQALTSLGYPVAADGKYGMITTGAVTAFQRRQNLTADGIAGNQTLSALYLLAPQYASVEGSNPQAAKTSAPEPQPQAIQNGGTALVRTGNTGGLYLRSAATSSDPRNILTTLPNGTSLELLAKGASWCRVRSGSLEGHVMTNYLAFDGNLPGSSTTAPGKTTQPPPAGSGSGTATVQSANKGALRLRSSASTSGNNVLLSIPYGSTLVVLSHGQQWSQVRYRNQDGYVVSSFLSFADAQAEPASTPTPAPQASPGLPPEETPAFTRTMRAGDKGDDVSLLQSKLANLLYPVAETGSYDDSTVSAVRSFQTNNALAVDGVFGAESARTLMSSSVRPGNSSPLTYKVLRVGDKDTAADQAVSTMQAALAALGYKCGVDGSYGNRTHDAVVAFQTDNDLVISGIADALTQLRLFSGSAKAASASSGTVDTSSAKTGGPSVSQVKLLDWYTQVKPSISAGQTAQVFDPATGINFNLRFYSLGAHADSEPLTLRDTQLMNASFGDASWNIHPVYVKLPNGTWTLAAMHNNPHLYGSIKDNGFGGHLCVHFKRELEETQKSDPNYGMQNQMAIRKVWERMTGQVVQ